MNKKLLATVCLLFLTACSQVIEEDSLEHSFDEKAQLNVVLSSVGLEGEENFSFSVLLERPDLEESQQDYDGPYVNDLPNSLNPKLMYVSKVEETDPQSGSMCYRPIFPHECSVKLDGDDGRYLVKVLFEDGSYGMQEVSVPIPEALKAPEIYEPSSTPKDNDSFYIEFEDVGADTYEATVILCHEYENDGVNPCLDGDNYTLNRESGQWVLDEFATFYNPVFEFTDGVVKIGSDLFLYLEESIEYEVYAAKETLLTTEDGLNIPALAEVWSYKGFP